MIVNISCVCPPLDDGQTRHPNGDTVTLADRLAFRDAAAMRYEIGIAKEEEPDISGADMLAILSESYIVHGVKEWSLERENDRGKVERIPVSRAALRAFLLDQMDVALTIADAADELYAEAVMLPLVRRGLTSSPNTPTGRSTSPSRRSRTKPQKRSKPSSITTIPTVDTEPTSSSLDGDSKSSPNSVSAA